MNKTDTVIVGAGPYGLSLAANLSHSKVSFRIFGEPMDTWANYMPKGMFLKSDGFASNLSAPNGAFKLKEFCASRKIPYHDRDIPVDLQTFIAYGLAFQQTHVPMLERCQVVEVSPAPNGFKVLLETGELVLARRVVLACGISHFAFVPPALRAIDSAMVSHSSQVTDPKVFAGKDVTVIGGGASAIDLAVLVHEAGAKTRIITRRAELPFHTKWTPGFWNKLRHPSSGIGPGWRSRMMTRYPHYFRLLPPETRLRIARNYLGPSAGYLMRARAEGKVEVVHNSVVHFAWERYGHPVLEVRNDKGESWEIETDHVIAGTGYRPDMERLGFLAPQLRSELRNLDGYAEVSDKFESSVKGLYFLGLATAASFGPMMRFAFGTEYAAKRLSKHLAATTRDARTYQASAGAKVEQERLLPPHPTERLS